MKAFAETFKECVFTEFLYLFYYKKLDTKSGYSNFDTMEKADAKKKTEFWHTEAFRTYVLIRVRLYSDENVGSKGLSVPKFCLFLCVRLLYSIKVFYYILSWS